MIGSTEFLGNTAVSGGAITIYQSNISIMDSYFARNEAAVVVDFEAHGCNSIFNRTLFADRRVHIISIQKADRLTIVDSQMWSVVNVGVLNEGGVFRHANIKENTEIPLRSNPFLPTIQENVSTWPPRNIELLAKPNLMTKKSSSGNKVLIVGLMIVVAGVAVGVLISTQKPVEPIDLPI
jgi:uncharacterized membrane protein